ncbi:MAG: aminotransferase [Bacillota bacterium]|nr:aminotransferase [Bacillota bacterium]
MTDVSANSNPKPGYGYHESGYARQDDQQEGQISETTVLIRVGSDGQLPIYATPGSAGCDLIAAADLVLLPGETRLLPLDFVMALEPGVEAQIRPRSGLSLRTSLRLPNTPGTIDSDYRAPVGVLVENTFSQADLPMQIIRKPELAKELAEPDRQLTLMQYLQRRSAEVANRDIATINTDTLNTIQTGLPELAGRIIYLDDQQNPYGTLYFKTGDRIAQMVFSRCIKANFVHSDQPEAVGKDRGGGFGSTGV